MVPKKRKKQRGIDNDTFKGDVCACKNAGERNGAGTGGSDSGLSGASSANAGLKTKVSCTPEVSSNVSSDSAVGVGEPSVAGIEAPVVREEIELTKEQIAELVKKAAERDEIFALLQRVQADYLNSQKRHLREKEEWAKFMVSGLISELLQGLDHLGMAVESIGANSSPEQIRDGIELTRREFMRVLEKYGLKRMEVKGQPFDPSFHEALMVEESSQLPPGTVMEEIRAGYMLHNRVLRAAQVKVSKTPADTGQVITPQV